MIEHRTHPADVTVVPSLSLKPLWTVTLKPLHHVFWLGPCLDHLDGRYQRSGILLDHRRWRTLIPLVASDGWIIPGPDVADLLKVHVLDGVRQARRHPHPAHP